METIIDAVVLEARTVETRAWEDLARLVGVLNALEQNDDTLKLRIAFINARIALGDLCDVVETVHTRRWAARSTEGE
jgi:hypothetical protein